MRLLVVGIIWSLHVLGAVNIWDSRLLPPVPENIRKVIDTASVVVVFRVMTAMALYRRKEKQ